MAGRGEAAKGSFWQRLSRVLVSRHHLDIRPHPGPTPGDGRPFGTGGKSGALRAAIFGVNDGLVSNLGLIMLASGAALESRAVVVAGVAGLLAGAYSMGWGEYVSMKSQRELFERLLHLEAHELATDPEEEHDELREIYERKGFPPKLARDVTDAIMRDPDVALETHAREELGLDPAELGSPWGAAVSSFVTFSLGALVPLLPFLITAGFPAKVWAVGVSGLVLFGVGAGLSALTGRHPWLSGLRMMLGGLTPAGATYAIGRVFHVTTGG